MIIGPKIKTDNLLLHLDAGSYQSYPKTGNIWYDLSGNNHHAYGDPGSVISGSDDVNFPVWQSDNGGQFYFGGSDGLTIQTDLGTQTTHTIESFFNMDSATYHYFCDARNSSGDYYFWNYSSHNINVEGKLTADDPETYQANSNWFDRWVHIAIVNTGAGSQLFIDGVQITDSRLKSSTAIDTRLGTDFRIGCRYTGSSRWIGYYGNFKIYSTALTPNEVLQNFNASKARFGL